MHSQGFAPVEDDEELGSDLSSAEDVPPDHTEADEGVPQPERRGRRARTEPERHSHVADAPGAGPATEIDQEHAEGREET